MEEIIKNYIINDLKLFPQNETIIFIPLKYYDDISNIFSITKIDVLKFIYRLTITMEITFLEMTIKNINNYTNELKTIDIKLGFKLLTEIRKIKLTAVSESDINTASKARLIENRIITLLIIPTNYIVFFNISITLSGLLLMSDSQNLNNL